MSTSDRPVEVWRLPEEDRRAGRRAATWTVGPDGELLVLLTAGPEPEPPYDACLVTVARGGDQRLDLPQVPLHHPTYLGLLPGGRPLVVDGRAEELADGWELNGLVFAPDGRPTRRLQLGDDVQALVTDREGRIWLAFGDEGRYGDNPLAQRGLLGLDGAGRTVWVPDFKDLPDDPMEGLAAATEGRRVWLAWYGERAFLTAADPGGGPPLSTRLPARQPVGFAVADDRAVFLQPDGELVRCVRESRKGWREVRRERLDLPGELDRHHAYGRDGVLWFRCGNGWYRVPA
ncbi:hypothetical protein [Kitasatospora sp. NPDC056531]|uniref:hypothetical protein n=1 Tax=Kitasatospora sp. NPDC056531 TaxID=3345856 RepID=UPI0036A11C3C